MRAGLPRPARTLSTLSTVQELLNSNIDPCPARVYDAVVRLEPEVVGPCLARQRRVSEHPGRRVDGHGPFRRQRADEVRQ